MGLNLLKRNIKKNIDPIPLSILSEWGHNIKWWKPGTNFKNHYILQKGNGIILDDSHEYDYVRWLLDDDVDSVYCQTRKSKKIKTETESIASIILKFKKGTIATFVIDYMRPYYERKCHVICENGDLKWNYVPKNGSWKQYGAKATSSVNSRFLNHKKLKYLQIPLLSLYDKNNTYHRVVINYLLRISLSISQYLLRQLIVFSLNLIFHIMYHYYL